MAHTLARAATPPVSHGTALLFETLSEGSSPLRNNPREDILLRVIHGTVHVAMGTEVHVLIAGGEAIVPAGVDHRLVSVDGEGRVLMGMRPRSR
jgi:quercetin dioxygenase-like cupin family protein